MGRGESNVPWETWLKKSSQRLSRAFILYVARNLPWVTQKPEADGTWTYPKAPVQFLSGHIHNVCLSSLRDQHEMLCRKCHQQMDNGELRAQPRLWGAVQCSSRALVLRSQSQSPWDREVRAVDPEGPPNLLYLQSKTLKSEPFFYRCIDFFFADMFKIMLPVNLFV